MQKEYAAYLDPIWESVRGEEYAKACHLVDEFVLEARKHMGTKSLDVGAVIDIQSAAIDFFRVACPGIDKSGKCICRDNCGAREKRTHDPERIASALVYLGGKMRGVFPSEFPRPPPSDGSVPLGEMVITPSTEKASPSPPPPQDAPQPPAVAATTDDVRGFNMATGLVPLDAVVAQSTVLSSHSLDIQGRIMGEAESQAKAQTLSTAIAAKMLAIEKIVSSKGPPPMATEAQRQEVRDQFKSDRNCRFPDDAARETAALVAQLAKLGKKEVSAGDVSYIKSLVVATFNFCDMLGALSPPVRFAAQEGVPYNVTKHQQHPMDSRPSANPKVVMVSFPGLEQAGELVARGEVWCKRHT